MLAGLALPVCVFAQTTRIAALIVRGALRQRFVECGRLRRSGHF
jgi:hypothetical protein